MANETTKNQFAKRLRRLIQEAGLKQIELVKLVQEQMPEHGRFERGQLSNYLAGKAMPRPIVFYAMCRALGVSPEQLLPSAKERAVYAPRS